VVVELEAGSAESLLPQPASVMAATAPTARICQQKVRGVMHRLLEMAGRPLNGRCGSLVLGRIVFG